MKKIPIFNDRPIEKEWDAEDIEDDIRAINEQITKNAIKMKEFTIGGKPRLQKAFAEVLGLPVCGGYSKDYPYLSATELEGINTDLNQSESQYDTHFELPAQWDEAMAYAREFYGIKKAVNKEKLKEIVKKTVEDVWYKQRSMNPVDEQVDAITDALYSELANPKQPKEEKPHLPESESDLPKTNLNTVARAFHLRAKEKGFWDEKREVGTLLMLIVSELSEALEADRKSKHANMEKYHQGIAHGELFETYIKDTFEDEIADVFIRLLDLCGAMNIDIDKHIELKMQYNQARDYKHGKAY